MLTACGDYAIVAGIQFRPRPFNSDLSGHWPPVLEAKRVVNMIRIARIRRAAAGLAIAAAVVATMATSAGAQQTPAFKPKFGQPPGFSTAGGDEEFGDSRDRVSVTAFTAQDKVAPGSDVVIAIVLDHQPGWHSWPNAGNIPKGLAEFSGAINTVITVKTSGANAAGLQVHDAFIQWPAVHAAKADIGEGAQEYATFSDRAIAYVPVTVKPDAQPGAATIDINISFQTCNETVCLAPADVDVPVAIQIVDAASLASSPATKANESDFTSFDPSVWSKIHSGAAPPKVVKFDLFGFAFEVNAAGPLGLLLLCLVAAFGGMLLNATPCVLPVIPIKIMSLSQHAGNRGRTLMLGFSMFLGVISLWMALGAAIAFIKTFTATNQLFQYPAFTISVGVVIAIMAVGMCGLFSVQLPQAVYMINPKQDSPQGSFLFGVMTAILSTPCTAPFMGAAAAWAATQSPAVVLTVFFAIGFGMGVPYFILSAFPKLVDKMPRTGPASEVIKQVMGLLMLAAAAYFIGVGLSGALVAPPDPPSRLYWWLVAALVAAAGGWMIWRTFGISKTAARRSVFGAMGAALVVIGFAGAVRLSDKGPINWIYYTPQRLAEAKAGGKVVVLEFTAEWCLNCKALEEAVLRNDRVAKLLNGKGVAPIKIDLTGNNIEGNAMLTSVQRRSIPLLVILAPDGRELFKSDFYTVDQVERAIAEAGSAKVAIK